MATGATVAVVGGGAAGIGAARTLLLEGLHVVLLEAAPRLGGNCRAEQVRCRGAGMHAVDLGVSDFNRATFRGFARLVDELGLETRPICTDASFATPDGRPVCSFRAGRWTCAPGLPDPEPFAREVEAFRARAVKVLGDERFARMSVADYLKGIGASPLLRDVYVHARAMGAFPMPDRHPGTYRIRDLVRFWLIHGVVGREPADRRCIVGGMHRYVEAYRAWFVARGGELRCGTRVLDIARRRGRVEIRTADDQGRHGRLDADHVILANPAPEALALLDAPSAEEADALRSVPYQRASVVMHRDPRVLGGDPAEWGAFNYVVPAGDLPRVRPTITFFPNRLAGLPAAVPDVFVTLNPHREPLPESVVARSRLWHPIAGAANDRAVARLERLQGRRRTWYAGSYLRSPFVHESALQSGMVAAQRIVRLERDRRALPRRRASSNRAQAVARSA